MLVTLDIFSGMPNPKWNLDPKQTKDLISRLAGKAVAAADAAESKLGFRGYVIEATGDDTLEGTGLPSSFRLAGAMAEEFFGAQAEEAPSLTGKESSDTALFLLETSAGAVDDELLKTVKEMISGAGPSAEAGKEEAGVSAACVLQHTPYNPAFWNTASVQPHNNCYNYAMNFRSNTFAQPGKISGHPNSVMQCPNVSTAANWDGCKATCSGPNKLVALVIWPGRDYHWYRYHSNGFWGHKPGSTAARNTDNSGIVIGGTRNPQNCNRGPYTIFCGYRYSPVGMKVA